MLIGDKGYLSSEIQLNLFETANIKLDTPKRKNQKDYNPQFYLFKRNENASRHFFHNFVISLRFIEFMLNPLMGLKLES